MTIAAGVICSDGVILCADTEHSGEIKFNRGKIHRVTFGNFGDYAITGTGPSAYLAMAADLIEEGLYANREALEGHETVERIYLFKEIIRQKTKALNQHIKACHLPDAWQSAVELLIGFHAAKSSSAGLLHVDPAGAVETIREEGIFIGAGASIAYGFARILWNNPLPIPMELMRWLLFFALYQAKMSAAGCGGNTDICRLPREPKRMIRIYGDADLSEPVESAMRTILLSARDPRVTAEQLTQALNDLTKTAQEVRKAMTDPALQIEWVTEHFKNRIRQGEV